LIAATEASWEDLYKIETDGFAWTAVPLFDPAVKISCNTLGGLRMALRDHYAERAEGQQP
jgi:hypothetical protein